ncbi:hypothetical protein GGI43DRAFT_432749 [Trichoderma evansii]
MDSSSSEDESTKLFPEGYSAPRTTEQLMRYHKDHLIYATADPIIPMDNLEERLRIIEEIRKGVSEDFQFTYFELAYFLFNPDSSLRKITDDGFHDSFLKAKIQYLETYLFSMLDESQWRDNSGRKKTGPEVSKENNERRAQLKKRKENTLQRAAEKEKCLVRDNYRCIFTQDDSPRVHQIMPFVASYINYTFIQLLDISSCFSAVLSHEACSQLNYFVCVGSDHCDKSWNMMSLGPNLRKLWKNHLFGIQCLGILPIDRQASAIWLQFHWMPRNRLNPNHRAEINVDAIQKMLQIIPPENNDFVEEYRSRTHHPLETGHIFSIRMGKQEAINMKHVIDLRWVVVRIVTISGLARSWSGVG